MSSYISEIVEEDVITCECCKKNFATNEITLDDFNFAWDNYTTIDCCSDCASNNLVEDEFIDFDEMDNSQKLAFLMERNGYIEDGIGLNEYGHEFRDDNGQALFIDEQEKADE